MGCCVATQISAGSVVKCSFPPSLCVPRRVEPRSASQIIEQKGWHVTPMFGLDSCFNGEACKVVSITQGKKQRLNIPLTEKEVFTIMRSWKNIQGKIIETGILMFLSMFENNPSVKSTFEKFRTLDCTEELWENSVLMTHGLGVMSAIDEIITNLDDEDTVYDLIIEQGSSHVRFGDDLTHDIFWAIEKPFLAAVKQMFGSRYTPKLETLYTVTIHYIISLLTHGFSSKMSEQPRDGLYIKQAQTQPRDGLYIKQAETQPRDALYTM